MIKKLLALLSGVLFVLLFVGTLYFLYQKSRKPPETYETVTASLQNLVQKTVATGQVKPRKEIDVKASVSGIISDVYFEAGDSVKVGDVLARIQMVPNMSLLRAAESTRDQARLHYSNAKVDFERQQSLKRDQLAAQIEYDQAALRYRLADEALKAAEDNVGLLREGLGRHSGAVWNQVVAPSAGILMSVPFKQGAFIIESNTFNAGTTIAQIANMDDMIFEGYVDEAEVGKLAVDMPLDIKVGALSDRVFAGKLEYISPKGVDQQGTMKFEIRAAIALQQGAFLRAGYSANAEVVLARADQVLAIMERDLIEQDGQIWVEVETAPQDFERRAITVGLSDGIHTQVLSGLSATDRIKKR
jgi:HlyD family secretion protein